MKLSEMFANAVSVQLHSGVDDDGCDDIEYLSESEIGEVVYALRDWEETKARMDTNEARGAVR